MDGAQDYSRQLRREQDDEYQAALEADRAAEAARAKAAAQQEAAAQAAADEEARLRCGPYVVHQCFSPPCVQYWCKVLHKPGWLPFRKAARRANAARQTLRTGKQSSVLATRPPCRPPLRPGCCRVRDTLTRSFPPTGRRRRRRPRRARRRRRSWSGGGRPRRSRCRRSRRRGRPAPRSCACACPTARTSSAGACEAAKRVLTQSPQLLRNRRARSHACILLSRPAIAPPAA